MSTCPTVLAPADGRATRSALSLAAASIVARPDSKASIGDILHGRALEHYAAGLEQYLALRLGTVVRARAAMVHLREVAAAVSPEDLLKAPGVRARLFRTAREIAKRTLARDGAPTCKERSELPWSTPPLTKDAERSAVQHLRAQLTDQAAEVLELRHVRGLDNMELAFTLGCPAQEVNGRITAAATAAREVIKGCDVETRAELQELLVRAYTLKPTSASTRIRESFEPLDCGDVVGGRYCVEKRVGLGAFGDVYRAQDTEVPGHIVALKLLHRPALSDVARARALREVHLIASVFHPSVVQFKDHGWLDRRLWFVMPWYEGETLESRMERGALSRQEARAVFEPLAHALATMHAAGIRHQDIKPENIFLTRLRGFSDREDQMLPVLLDLGVAAKEAEMVVAGTPTYFAPEVAAQFTDQDGSPSVTLKADVFALALSLRNALEPGTQDDVHGGAVDAFIRRRATTRPSDPLARDLSYLGRTLARWMSLNPEERPTAEEFATELEVLNLPEVKRERRRSLIRTVAPLAIALALVSASSIYISQERAAHEHIRAERALSAAELLRENLEASEQRGRELAHNVDAIRTDYDRSRLTREELAGRLIATETDLNNTRVDGEEQGRRLRRARDEATRSRIEIERVNRDVSAITERLQAAESRSRQRAAQLVEFRANLTASRQSTEQATRRANRFSRELSEARSLVEHTEGEVAGLTGRLRTENARLQAEQAKSNRLEQQISQAETANALAQGEITRLRRQIRRAAPSVAPGSGPANPDHAGELPAPESAPSESLPPEPVANSAEVAPQTSI